MDFIIYSNNAGIYVFDTDYNLVDKRIRDSIVDNAFEWQEDEKAIIEVLKTKNKHSKFYFLGHKNNKQEGVILTKDQVKLDNILKAEPSIIDDLKTSDIKVTIKKINKELNDKSHKISKSISIIEDIEDNLKLLYRRIHEEVEYYNPDLMPDGEIEDYNELLEKAIGYEIKDFGADMSDIDKNHLNNIKDHLNLLVDLKNKELTYLDELLFDFCPNFKEVAGSLLAAKLIKKAGTLHNLAFMPSSLVQIIGAEKALFRHIKDSTSAPPKYGLLLMHPIVSKSKDKGKAARVLAGKITIAIRTDYFSPGKIIFKDMKKEIEEKLGVSYDA